MKKVELEHELEIAVQTIADLHEALKGAESRAKLFQDLSDSHLDSMLHTLSELEMARSEATLNAKARDELWAQVQNLEGAVDRWISEYLSVKSELQAELDLQEASAHVLQHQVIVLTNALGNAQGLPVVKLDAVQ